MVSLLHSYRNRHNEAAVKAIIDEVAPELLTSCSADIWPIIREYERTITATINAYVQPMVIHYLESFEQALQRLGVRPPPRITKSNGGVMGVDQAKRECVQMVLSGTASGVIGASYLASACGFDKILSLDIGGTSADVAVIIDGKAGTGQRRNHRGFPESSFLLSPSLRWVRAAARWRGLMVRACCRWARTVPDRCLARSASSAAARNPLPPMRSPPAA